MKRILCVHQGYELYGSDRTFIQSVRALRHKWPQAFITVHLPQKGKLSDALWPFCNEIITGHLSVIRRKTFSLQSFLKFLDNVFRNYNMIKNSDLIYINSAVVFSYIFITFFRRKNYILHIHEIPTGVISFYFCLISLLSKARIITNSSATKNALCHSGKAEILYNGVKNIAETPQYIESGALSLLLIGRLNSWKGQAIAIEAVSTLIQKGIRNIQLHIVGGYFADNKHYLSSLQEMVIRSHLQDYVHFHQFADNPARFYQDADIVLVPSTKPEPFGLVAIEAMNYARPVIAANHGGLTEIIQHDVTGMLVAPGSADKLAEAIERYNQDRPMIKVHGTNGKQRFIDYFQEENYETNFIRLVENAS